jgi:hypothetical protein
MDWYFANTHYTRRRRRRRHYTREVLKRSEMESDSAART